MITRRRGRIGLPAILVPLLMLPLLPIVSAQGTSEKAPQQPLGLPPVQWPQDNPYSSAKADLGRFLYFDKRVSSDGSVSCASCHAPEKAFTDGAPVSTGIGGQKGGRSAPTVINQAYNTLQFWDG